MLIAKRRGRTARTRTSHSANRRASRPAVEELEKYVLLSAGDFQYGTLVTPGSFIPVSTVNGPGSEVSEAGVGNFADPTLPAYSAAAATGADIVVGTIDVTDLAIAADYTDTYGPTTITVSLKIKDVASGATGTFTFTGSLSGTVASNGTTSSSSFDDPFAASSQTQTIGSEVYTVSIVPGKAFCAPGSPPLSGTGVHGEYSFHVSTAAPPPRVTPPTDQGAVEGSCQSFNLGSFTDFTGATGPWAVDVNWGDNTPDTTFNTATTGSLGSRDHTYGEEGSKTVTVRVTDTGDGQTGSATYGVTVSDPVVVPGRAVAVDAAEGTAFTAAPIATFTDPGGAEPNLSDSTDGIASHYTVVSIDWGDGSLPDTTSGGIGFGGSQGSTTDPFTVSGSHTYGEEGTYTITAIVDHEAVRTTLTGSAIVSDPAVQATGVPVSGVECRPLSVVTVATFTDPGGAEPNTADHYNVISIDWGDQTTSGGSISYGGAPGSTTDPFTVTGTHTYAIEGAYTITALIDHEGVRTDVTTTAVVRDDFGLLLLDPTGNQSLMLAGNGSVTVAGDCGAAVVDSGAGDAASVTGNGVVSAGDFDVTGGVVTPGHGVVPSPVDHEAPTADPLGLGLPSPLPGPPSGNTATVLHPGTYVGGLHIAGKSAVTLMPGVYVMRGGGFAVDGPGSVTGSGVVIVNIPGGPGDTISVSGQGNLSLSAPTTGPYSGVAVMQVDAAPVAFSGQASVAIAGVFYTPNAPVSVTGNAIVTVSPGPGIAAPSSLSAAMIAYDLMVAGNGAITIRPDGPPATVAATSGSPAGGLHAAALDALINAGEFGGPALLADLQEMDAIAASLPLLAAAPDPVATVKKR